MLELSSGDEEYRKIDYVENADWQFRSYSDDKRMSISSLFK